MLLSPTTSRRLSGGAPAVRRSNSARPFYGRRSSASHSGGIAAGPKPAAAQAVAAMSVTVAGAPEPRPAASGMDEARPEAADDAEAARVDFAKSPLAAPEEPARRSKRRRLSSSAAKAEAVPVQHQGGDVKITGTPAPADKPFSDEVVTLERMQSVQCDRCSKWRVVDPDYQVRARHINPACMWAAWHQAAASR